MSPSLRPDGPPLLTEGAPRICIEDFVRAHGDVIVQERDPAARSPRDFMLSRIRDFHAEAVHARVPWHVDHPGARYLFHDILLDDEDPLSSFFDEIEPPEYLVDMSEALPCVAIRMAMAGPGSYTNLHYHGPTACLLLDGTKHWWMWPAEARDLLWWLVCGLRARNRHAAWLEHVAPWFSHETGDTLALVRAMLRSLEAEGRFRAPDSGHPSTTAVAEILAGRRPVPGLAALRGIEFVQRAGEIAFVPDGWCHAVRNLDWHLAAIYELAEASRMARRSSTTVDAHA